MIIQCEQCQAKFRLDDSKVVDKSVKVRCSKCKHVFTIAKEQPKTEPFTFDSSPEQTLTNKHEDTSLPPPLLHQSGLQESSSPFSFGAGFPNETNDVAESAEPDPFVTSASELVFAPAGNDEFSLSSLEGDKGFAVERDGVPSAQADVDFGNFDFGDSGMDTEKTMIAPPSSADFGDKTMIQPIIATKVTAQVTDFSDKDMFGTAISQPVAEPAGSALFDLGTVSLIDAAGMAGTEEMRKDGSSLPPDSEANAPFNPGEIDFGDEHIATTGHQVNYDQLAPSHEVLSTPLSKTHDTPVPVTDNDLGKTFHPGAEQAAQEDLPPLPISSRRKQNPLSAGLIAVVALLMVGALGYFGFSSFSEDKDKVVQEVGKISVRAVKASYVKNNLVGSLLVISGEAVNEYPAPRAALQIKGMIFDNKGQVLASKSAFGGNMLTNEQLAGLPLDKIEAAMANQFGDSLANLEVAPGKSVPFMVIISTPPKEGKDFGVEPVGSTVASGKQK
ncbi:MAG: DUF3426 domain-containing protein [Desulfuromonadales bacterium]